MGMKLLCTCTVEGCDREHYAKKYCRVHYERAKLGIPMEVPIRRNRRKPRLCTIEGCSRKHYCKGYCEPHYKEDMYHKSVGGPFRKNKRRYGLNIHGYVRLTINGLRNSVHVWMAIAALGKPLPESAKVHHVNGIRNDNRPENLVVCPDQAYHLLIEARTKAFEACGHADWLKCKTCKSYDAPSNFKGLVFNDFGFLEGYNRREHLNCERMVLKTYKVNDKNTFIIVAMLSLPG